MSQNKYEFANVAYFNYLWKYLLTVNWVELDTITMDTLLYVGVL